ncbi:MAG: FG-GAP-like repeat-containing protein [Chitinophagales bacterium]|nr:FG-GAP-like repeat-containing protein [Chitinophagales bacterium]
MMNAKPLLTLCFTLTILFLQAQNANFIDYSEEAGIDNSGKNYGVAFGDYNNDGMEDIYISRHTLPNLLYKAIGDGQFIDVAEQAGVAFSGNTTVSTWGDIDNDGDLDLYLGNRIETNVLYLNNGNGTFTDITEAAGVNSGHSTRAVLFGDIDQDSYIDLYVANMNAPNYLYHNNGDGTFTNIVEEANAQDFGVAMGSLFFDYDNDGDLDLYLTHDANQPNILYRNEGDGTFSNTSAFSGANIAAQGMGVDFGDINNDGQLDLYITNLYSNELLLNNGDGTFDLVTETANVGDMGMGWGTVWLDCDNDGKHDIYMSNDSYFTPFANILYQNNGDGSFTNISEGSVLESMYGGYGVAAADVNRDGLIDLFQANSGTNDHNQLFLNQSQNQNHWIKLKLKGTESNAAAIGARVTIHSNGTMQVDEVCAGSGYASQNSFLLHFGLAGQEVVDLIEIRWPNGLEESYENITADQAYTLVEGEGILSDTEDNTPLFTGIELYPVPARKEQSINLSFTLQHPDNVSVEITNAAGQIIHHHLLGKLSIGQHQFNFQLKDPKPGVYFCRLSGQDHFRTMQVILH